MGLSVEQLGGMVRGLREGAYDLLYKPEKDPADTLRKHLKDYLKHPSLYPPGGHILLQAKLGDPNFTLFVNDGETEREIVEDDAYGVLKEFGWDGEVFAWDRKAEMNLVGGMVLKTALHPSTKDSRGIFIARYRFTDKTWDMITIGIKGKTDYDHQVISENAHVPEEKALGAYFTEFRKPLTLLNGAFQAQAQA